MLQRYLDDVLFLFEILACSASAVVVMGGCFIGIVFYLSKTSRSTQVKKYYQIRHSQ